jgi:hypothetical protein
MWRLSSARRRKGLRHFQLDRRNFIPVINGVIRPIFANPGSVKDEQGFGSTGTGDEVDPTVQCPGKFNAAKIMIEA